MNTTEHLYNLKIKKIWRYLKSQDSLFWLINIYLFFEYVRPQTLYPVIDVIPYSQTILLLTVGLFILRPKKEYTQNPVNRLVVWYLVVVIISSSLAISPAIAYNELYIYLSWALIYLLIINIVNTEKRLFIFILAFLVYSFKMSQFSFLNWMKAGFSFIKIGSGGGPGWFHNSGEFGIQMVVFFSMSICFVFALKNYWPRWKRWLMFLFPLTALSGTVSSSSRGAVLGVAAVALFFVMKSRYRVKSLIALVVAGFVVYSFIPEQQLERFAVMGKDATSMSRISLWERGVDIVSRYPLFGVGYKNWIIANKKIYGLENVEVSHNIFIECASEVGLIGLLVFSLMIVHTFVNNHRTRKLAKQADDDNRFLFYMAHGLDGALVGYLVSGMFVTVLYYPYFWINLSMTVALHEAARRKVGNGGAGSYRRAVQGDNRNVTIVSAGVSRIHPEGG